MLPQACLRSDRESTLEGLSLPEDAAMASEFRHGLSALAAPGLAEDIGRFSAGPGGRPPPPSRGTTPGPPPRDRCTEAGRAGAALPPDRPAAPPLDHSAQKPYNYEK